MSEWTIIFAAISGLFPLPEVLLGIRKVDLFPFLRSPHRQFRLHRRRIADRLHRTSYSPEHVDSPHGNQQRLSFSVEAIAQPFEKNCCRDAEGAIRACCFFTPAGWLRKKNLSCCFMLWPRSRNAVKPDFRLLIAGDGIERTHWESFCREHIPGKVLFLGHIKESLRSPIFWRTQIYSFIQTRANHLGSLPSRRWRRDCRWSRQTPEASLPTQTRKMPGSCRRTGKASPQLS